MTTTKRTRGTKPRRLKTKKGASAPFYRGSPLESVDIYTDGSASHISRSGGWGCIIVFPDGYEHEMSGSYSNVTNNAMEIEAAIRGMSYFRSPRIVTIHSDSAYLVNSVTYGWCYDWERRGFVNRRGMPTPNKERWIEVMRLCSFHVVKMNKVKAHSGHPYNDRCDELAKRARKALQYGPPGQNRVSKRKSRKYTLALKESVRDESWNTA